MPEPTLMASVAPGLIGAGAQVLSSIFAGKGEDDARKWNAREAAKSRQFSERMRNTQWQAGVEDMRAAGLNPALAYAKGPAAAPSGAQASGAQSKTMHGAQMANLAAQTAKTYAEARTARAQAQKTEEETKWWLGGRMSGTINGQPFTTENRLSDLLSQTLQQQGLRTSEIEQTVSKIMSEIKRNEAVTAREGATASMLQPMANLADQMGMAFPLLSLFAPGGFAGNIARRMRIPRFGSRLSAPRRMPRITAPNSTPRRNPIGFRIQR